MRRFIIAACAGILALAMTPPTLAADLPPPVYKPGPKSPSFYSPVPVFSWTGFYVGVNGGYAFGSSEWSNATGSSDFAIDGGLIGGTLGYNLQTGTWVWGIEGDIAYSWIEGNNTNAGAGGVCGGGTGCTTRNNWFGTLRGRIGYAAGRWLPYFTGGLAFGDVEMTPNNGVSETDSQFGWTIGAGVEYAFLSPWTFKLEYLYTDLGKAECSAATCGINTDVSFQTHTIRAGVNYRF